MSKKKLQKLRKRKNPTDEHFTNQLINALVGQNPVYLSQALSYKGLGFTECDACKEYYMNCKCDGSRSHVFDKYGHVIQGVCEQCLQNHCICDFRTETIKELINSVLDLAISVLDKEQLLYFENSIKDWLENAYQRKIRKLPNDYEKWNYILRKFYSKKLRLKNK